jgi:hypothetical protein
MKCVMLQAASGPFVQLQREVYDWHSAYCAKHDIDYLCHLGRVPSTSALDPTWDCVPLMRLALGLGYDLVVWLDTDALVVNPEVDLREASKEFRHVGMVKHRLGLHSHFNCGVTFVSNTEKARDFLAQTEEGGPVARSGWHEQARMHKVNAKLGVIHRIDDRWNSTEGINEVADPVIAAWHGDPDRISKVRAAIRKLEAR